MCGVCMQCMCTEFCFYWRHNERNEITIRIHTFIHHHRCIPVHAFPLSSSLWMILICWNGLWTWKKWKGIISYKFELNSMIFSDWTPSFDRVCNWYSLTSLVCPIANWHLNLNSFVNIIWEKQTYFIRYFRFHNYQLMQLLMGIVLLACVLLHWKRNNESAILHLLNHRKENVLGQAISNRGIGMISRHVLWEWKGHR